MRFIWTGLLAVLVLCEACASVGAAPIVSVTGARSAGYGWTTTEASTVVWTQNYATSGVSISADIVSFSAGVTGKAYLTTRVGAGTTPADQVAATTFMVPTSNASFTTLFTGLDLPAATYYLTLVGATPGTNTWYATLAPGTSAPGVSIGAPLYASPVNSFGPASDFVLGRAPTSTRNFRFVVEGTVPEPAGLLLCPALALVLGGRARR